MKCKDCVYYKENPEFDYYDISKGNYANCEMERDDIFWSDFVGVYQECWGYEVNCSDYKLKED